MLTLSYNKLCPLFWLRKAKKRKKDGKSPIYLRFTINGERANDGNSTMIYVSEEDFDPKQNMVLPTDPHHEHKNSFLRLLILDAESLKVWLERGQRKVSAKEFLYHFKNKTFTQAYAPTPNIPAVITLAPNYVCNAPPPTLSEICEQFLKDCPLPTSQNRIIKNHLKVFCDVAPKNKPAQDYKRSDFDKLAKDYLATPPTKKIKHPNQRENYLHHCFVSLKRVFVWCAEEEILPKNNFALTTITQKHPDPDFLLLEEIEKILTFNFSMCEIENEKGEKEKIKPKEAQKMNETRTYFLFCIYTGLYPSDYLNLVNKDQINITINQDEQGENLLWLKGKRQKGRGKRDYGTFEMPLMGEAKNIWEKTNGNLPLIDDDPNYYLGKMGKYLGFPFHITSKLARTTFVWLCMNCWNIPDNTTARMIGHSDTSVLKKYARIFDKKIMRDTAHIK
jgi:integrase